jgi:hypothetical protein
MDPISNLEEKRLQYPKAKIIDIPFEALERREPADGEGCEHTRSNGRACGRPRWGERRYCAVHGEWDQTMASAMGLPFPEDAMSLHRFLLKCLDMVVCGKLNDRRARAVEGLCRMIVRNMEREIE